MAAAPQAFASEAAWAKGQKAEVSEAKLDYGPLVAELRRFFDSGATLDIEWRKGQLHAMKKMMMDHQQVFTDALVKDLGRHPANAALELMGLFPDIDEAINSIHKWTARRPTPVRLEFTGGSSYIQPQPKGVVLNICPWNFPFQLAFSPMCAIIAAGNCCVLKPSEMSVNCAKVLEDLVPKYMDPRAFRVVNGAVAETTALLKERWDHILYTGNGFVGKIVMKAAAEYLTPVTLELGGKSPVIVDKEVDLPAAVKRIIWGKTFNAGQICLAPDYVLLHRAHEQTFFRELDKTVKDFFPEGVANSESFARIINGRHVQRIGELLSADHGGQIVCGGLEQFSQDRKFVPLTVIKSPSNNSRLMNEEIFGPLLPVVLVDSVEDAVKIVNSKEKPLGLYVFSKSNRTVDYVLNNTSSGGATVNDVLLHGVADLPFGGVGPAGMGHYHGIWGFDEFSHLRGVLHRGQRGIDIFALSGIRYPPFNKATYQRITQMIRWGGPVPPLVAKAGGLAVKLGIPLFVLLLWAARR